MRPLIDWKSGNKEALDLLIPIVYRESEYSRVDLGFAVIQRRRRSSRLLRQRQNLRGGVAGITMQASMHGHCSAYFPFPITRTSFDLDNIVIGHAEGGVQNFWRKSTYLDPEQ